MAWKPHGSPIPLGPTKIDNASFNFPCWLEIIVHFIAIPFFETFSWDILSFCILTYSAILLIQRSSITSFHWITPGIIFPESSMIHESHLLRYFYEGNFCFKSPTILKWWRDVYPFLLSSKVSCAASPCSVMICHSRNWKDYT